MWRFSVPSTLYDFTIHPSTLLWDTFEIKRGWTFNFKCKRTGMSRFECWYDQSIISSYQTRNWLITGKRDGERRCNARIKSLIICAWPYIYAPELAATSFSINLKCRSMFLFSLNSMKITYSSFRSPFDQTITALTGMSLPAFKSTLVLDFFDVPPALEFVEGCMRRWYCGFTIYVGYVELPPEFLVVRVPSTYDSKFVKEDQMLGEYSYTYPGHIWWRIGILIPSHLHASPWIYNHAKSDLLCILIALIWSSDRHNSRSMSRWNPDFVQNMCTISISARVG